MSAPDTLEAWAAHVGDEPAGGLAVPVLAESLASYIDRMGRPCSFSVPHLVGRTGLTFAEVEAQAEAIGGERQRVVMCDCDSTSVLTGEPGQQCHVCCRRLPRWDGGVLYRFGGADGREPLTAEDRARRCR